LKKKLSLNKGKDFKKIQIPKIFNNNNKKNNISTEEKNNIDFEESIENENLDEVNEIIEFQIHSSSSSKKDYASNQIIKTLKPLKAIGDEDTYNNEAKTKKYLNTSIV